MKRLCRRPLQQRSGAAIRVLQYKDNRHVGWVSVTEKEQTESSVILGR
jgi:hypothetical protein